MLVERSMGQSKPALHLSALIRSMMKKSSQMEIFVGDGYGLGLVLCEDRQRQ